VAFRGVDDGRVSLLRGRERCSRGDGLFLLVRVMDNRTSGSDRSSRDRRVHVQIPRRKNSRGLLLVLDVLRESVLGWEYFLEEGFVFTTGFPRMKISHVNAI
jgi:hypothetical protein